MNAAATTSPKLLYTVSELRELPVPPEGDWLVQHLITRGGRVVLYGPAGLGKSTLALQLAAALATGEPFAAGFEVPQPRRVVVLQQELSAVQLRAGSDVLASAHPAIQETRRLQISVPAGIRLPGDIDRVRELLVDADVLVVDPFYAFFEGKTLDDPVEVAPVLYCLGDLVTEGALEAVVVVHHSPKPSVWRGRDIVRKTSAGSWLFAAWPDTVLRLASVNSASQRSLVVEKQRMPLSPQGVRYELDFDFRGYRATHRGPEGAALPTSQGETDVTSLRALLLAVGGSRTRAQLTRLTRWERPRMEAAMAALGDELSEETERGKKGRPAKIYRLRAQT